VNTTRKPFNDPRVRQALALAVDKERLTKKITRAGEEIADSITPPGIARYHPPKGLGYDPERARKLLVEAGYPGGKGFPRFQYLLNAAAGGAANIHAKIAVEMQQMWHDELGINMELRQAEWGVYLSAQDKLDYDVCRASWIGDYNDPDTFLNLFVSNNENNRTGWSTAVYDAAIDEADREVDLAKREKIFQKAETLLVGEELPVIPLYYYVGFSYYDTNRVKGIYGNGLDMHPINGIWLSNQTPPTEWAQKRVTAEAAPPKGER
jgi:oligopeptide transport system substrate-binding protein